MHSGLHLLVGAYDGTSHEVVLVGLTVDRHLLHRELLSIEGGGKMTPEGSAADHGGVQDGSDPLPRWITEVAAPAKGADERPPVEAAAVCPRGQAWQGRVPKRALEPNRVDRRKGKIDSGDSRVGAAGQPVNGHETSVFG
jgi:hypothetical protein